MKSNILASLCLSLAAVACDDASNSKDAYKPSADNNYLPIAVGNYWDFVEKNANSNSPVVEHREVTGKTTIENKEYYVIVSTRPTPSGPLVDSAYYRIETNGYTFTYSKYVKDEYQNFRLNANSGDVWTYTFGDVETTVELTDISVELGDQTAVNCKNYFIDTRQMADEEYTVILAPGIGFAKEYSNAWGGGQRVKSVKINGVVRNF